MAQHSVDDATSKTPSDRPEIAFMDDAAPDAPAVASRKRAARLGGVRTWFGVSVLLATVPGFAMLLCYWLTEPKESVSRLVVGSALVGVLAFLAARHIAATRILVPIERLSRAAERLRAGDLGARTGAPYMPGELGRLEVSFDAMAAALEWDERKFAAAERRYRAIVESIPAVLYVQQIDATGRVGSTTYVSPQIRTFAGYEPRLFTKDPTAWIRVVHPDDRPRVLAEFHRTVGTGEPFAFDHRIVARGGKARWMRNTGTLVRDEGGRPAYVRGFVVDVTERKTLEEQFQRAQKLEAVGQLAAGVAHDFNNLLTVIGGYAHMLLDRLPPDDPNRASVGEMRVAADRAALLTHQLLAFSRKQTLQPKVLDLNALITESSKMLGRLIGADVELVTVLSSRLGRVRADAAQLDHVLLNLAANARDAMPRGGRLTIETRDTEIDAAYAEAHPGVRMGRYAMVSVADTGCGMDAATLARVFEPFFTTKPKGMGTGLGLASVYGIVEQSGGHIDVESDVGVGTKFRIYLPRIEQAAASASAPDEGVASAHGGTETILVAEDEDTVRGLVREVLQGAGYSVLEGASPSETLAVASAYTGRIALVLADVVLPEMSGPDLVGRLRAILPDVRVTYMSGHTYEALGHRRVLAADTDFVQKPFTPEELRRKVREVLDRPRRASDAAPAAMQPTA